MQLTDFLLRQQLDCAQMRWCNMTLSREPNTAGSVSGVDSALLALTSEVVNGRKRDMATAVPLVFVEAERYGGWHERERCLGR